MKFHEYTETFQMHMKLFHGKLNIPNAYDAVSWNTPWENY